LTLLLGFGVFESAIMSDYMLMILTEDRTAENEGSWDRFVTGAAVALRVPVLGSDVIGRRWKFTGCMRRHLEPTTAGLAPNAGRG
jgi:hypothetical protein